MADRIHIDAHSLAELGRDFRLAAGALAREGAPVLERIGAKLEESAKRIASENGSTSIPGSIKGGLRGSYAYEIRAGEGVPIASLWELGNAGSRRRTKFKHPVFGRPNSDVWQPMHPFLRPALAENRAWITAELERVWDRVLTPYNLHPNGVMSSFGGGINFGGGTGMTGAGLMLAETGGGFSSPSVL